MSLQLIIGTDDPNGATLYANLTSLSKITIPRQVRNDIGIELDIIPVTENVPGATQVLLTDFATGDTFDVAIGTPDNPPDSGTFKLAVNGSSTGLTALAYNINAASLTTPLSAAMVAAGYPAGTVAALDSGDAYFFSFTGNANGAVLANAIVGDATNLLPTCEIEISEVSLGSVSTPYQYIISITEVPPVTCSPATPLPSITIANTVTQVMDDTLDAINTVSFNVPPMGGTFSVSAYVLGFTQGCGVANANMTASDFQALLQNHAKLSGGGRVSVNKNSTAFVAQFIGSAGPKPITGSTIANPTVITCVGHGYTNGQSVTHSGTNSTPDTDGPQVATVIDDDTYSVPVNVTVAGTSGITRDSTAPLLTVTDIDLVGGEGVSGVLNLNTVNLFKKSLSETQISFDDLYITVRRTRLNGESRVILGPVPITIAKDLGEISSLVQPLRPGPNVGNTLYVDDVFGNDTSGLRQNALYPFKTIKAAGLAAHSGDLIVVGPGTYDENNVVPALTGINYCFEAGAEIVYTGSDTNAIFDDNAAPMELCIDGYGHFECTDAASIVVKTLHPDTSLHLHGKECFAPGVVFSLGGDASIVHLDYIEHGGAVGTAAFVVTDGDNRMEVLSISGRALIASGGAFVSLLAQTLAEDGLTDQVIDIGSSVVTINCEELILVGSHGIRITSASSYLMFQGRIDCSAVAGKNPILCTANGTAIRLRSSALIAHAGRDSIETSGGATPTVQALGVYANTDVDAAVIIVGDYNVNASFT